MGSLEVISTDKTVDNRILFKCQYCKELFVYNKTKKIIQYDGKSKKITDFIRCPYCGSAKVIDIYRQKIIDPNSDF